MLFFIGMPGAGKSYWASSVAAAYGLPFIDLDTHFENRVGMKLADYFDKYGEAEFRLREQEALHDIIQNKDANYVVACGGGTPAFFDSLGRMNSAGCTIYLKASLKHIMARLSNSPTRRPLLEGKEIKTALMELYNKRDPFFSQAGHIFDVDTMSITHFEKIIPACIGRQ